MSPSKAVSKSSTRRSAKSSSGSGGGNYWVDSQRPIVMLAFLAPFVALYEAGTRLFHIDVAAFSLLRQAAGYLQVYGRGVPAALLVLTLLAWHLLKQDAWRVRLKTLGGMFLESLLFAIPVLAISLLCRRYLPLIAMSQHGIGRYWVLSLGAGLYEELLFRFYLCGGLNLLLLKGMRLKPTLSLIMSIAVSSVLFSLYHYLGESSFNVPSFTFRTVAGAYFAGLFLTRGFGVTAASHAFYDIIVVTLRGV